MKACAGKILIIVQNLPVPFDRRVWLEALTLTQAGYRVTVISPRGKKDMKFQRLDGIAIYRYWAPTNAQGFWGYFFEFSYCWLMTFYLSLKIWLTEGFDVVQACNPPDTYWLLGWFYRRFGKPFIFDHHDLAPEMYRAKYQNSGGFLFRCLLFLERMTFQTAALVLCTNESHKKIAVDRGRVAPERIFIVRTGPDFRRLQVKAPESALKNGHQYLACYLGEMCPQDGVDLLLQSIHHIVHERQRRDIQFVLMGGGPAQPAMEKLAGQLGLDVVFTGRIPDDLVCRYLSTADITLDPDPKTEWADQSTMNKVMEYMTFGKPIVAYDLKETRFSARRAAVYAAANDPIDFAMRILELLDQPHRRQRMGRLGRLRVVQKLSWEHTHTPLLKAYQQIFGALKFRVPANPALVLENG